MNLFQAASACFLLRTGEPDGRKRCQTDRNLLRKTGFSLYRMGTQRLIVGHVAAIIDILLGIENLRPGTFPGYRYIVDLIGGRCQVQDTQEKLSWMVMM